MQSPQPEKSKPPVKIEQRGLLDRCCSVDSKGKEKADCLVVLQRSIPAT